MPNRIIVMAGFVVAALIATAGCTATTEVTQTANSSTTNPPATAKPPPTQDRKSDGRIAEKSVLTVDDLSDPGWEEGSSRERADAKNDFKPDCPALGDEFKNVLKLSDEVPASKSPTFKQAKKQLELFDDVLIFATVDQALDAANVFGNPEIVPCLQNYLKTAATKDTSVPIDAKKIKVERTATGPLGDDHGVFTATVPVQTTTGTTDVTVVYAFIRVGRGYTEVAYTAGSVTAPPDLEKDIMPILRSAADKLKKNLGD